MRKVLVFTERMLPSTQTFIPLQVRELRRYEPRYVGLIPALTNLELQHPPVLLTHDRTHVSRVRRELFRWTGFAPQFKRAVRREQANLLHAHFAEATSAAVFLSKNAGLPMVLHLRGGAELLSGHDLKQHTFQWPYLAYRRSIWKRATVFLCVSEYIRRKAIVAGFPADKLRVHYTGMNFSAFTPRDPPSEKDANLILYVGRLVPYKGADYLIRAMHRLQQQQPTARLVLIGDGFFRTKLEELNRELGVKALFLGELPQSTVRDWLERARVFCGPSVTLEDGMSEAFGNVFSEAQAMGVPVVSFRHGGIPETMQEGVTGLLAPERDVEQLSTHLLRFLKDERFWSHARQEGMAWVRQNFSVQTQTSRLEDIYDEVIATFREDRYEQDPLPF